MRAALTALALALLAGGLAWLWQEHGQLADRVVDRAEITALHEQVRGLNQRLAQLEQRAPVATDLRPLEGRIAALEQRPATPPPVAPPPAAPPPAVAAADPVLAGRIAALDLRVTQAEQARSGSTIRLARLQRAGHALAAGQVLGDIPGAPAALSRFAAIAPPTEAALRLEFPAAARQAEAASRAGAESQGIADRVWQQVRSLVTVRDGDTVLLGAPAAVVLGTSRELLNAGDLAGAVAALDALDPGAAGGIAAWRARAASVLAARAALAAMLGE